MSNRKDISKMGYRDDSPYRNRPYIDIETPSGMIDMSQTGIPLFANGQLLPPYSGQHNMGTTNVREVPLEEHPLLTVKSREGTAESIGLPDSTHLMQHEKLPDGTWIAFPKIFQNENGEWINFEEINERDGWWENYQYALERNEVYGPFRSEEHAASFAVDGTWKNPTMTPQGEYNPEGFIPYPMDEIPNIFPPGQVKFGGQLPKAQDLGEFNSELTSIPQDETSLSYKLSMNRPIIDSNGKCWANCGQRFYMPELNVQTGISTELNLTPAEELAAMEARVWAGLTWNADQSGRTQAGLKTYLGGNAGVKGIYSNLLNEYNAQPVANAVVNIGFEGDAEDMDNYKTYQRMIKQDRRGDPNKYGYGLTAEYDLLNTPGEFSWDNFDIGAYLNFANKGITFDWNPATNQKTLGIQMGLSNKKEGGRVLPKAQINNSEITSDFEEYLKESTGVVNNWTDKQLLNWIGLQNELMLNKYTGDESTSKYDPHNIDLMDRSTWPSIDNTFLDESYNVSSKYPWLPDMSTEEGRSAIYNLHRAAVNKFPDKAGQPGLYWLLDPDGKGTAYPYKNESRSEKILRDNQGCPPGHTLMDNEYCIPNDQIEQYKEWRRQNSTPMYHDPNQLARFGGSLPKAVAGGRCPPNCLPKIKIKNKTNPDLFKFSSTVKPFTIRNRGDLLSQYALRNNIYRTVNIDDKIINNIKLKENAKIHGFDPDKHIDFAAYLASTPTGGSGRRSGYEDIINNLTKDLVYYGNYPGITNRRYTTGLPENSYTAKSRIWTDDVNLLSDTDLHNRISLLDMTYAKNKDLGLYDIGLGNININSQFVPHGSVVNTNTLQVPNLTQTTSIIGDMHRPVRKVEGIIRGDDLIDFTKDNKFLQFEKYGGQLPKAQRGVPKVKIGQPPKYPSLDLNANKFNIPFYNYKPFSGIKGTQIWNPVTNKWQLSNEISALNEIQIKFDDELKLIKEANKNLENSYLKLNNSLDGNESSTGPFESDDLNLLLNESVGLETGAHHSNQEVIQNEINTILDLKESLLSSFDPNLEGILTGGLEDIRLYTLYQDLPLMQRMFPFLYSNKLKVGQNELEKYGMIELGSPSYNSLQDKIKIDWFGGNKPTLFDKYNLHKRNTDAYDNMFNVPDYDIQANLDKITTNIPFVGSTNTQGSNISGDVFNPFINEQYYTDLQKLYSNKYGSAAIHGGDGSWPNVGNFKTGLMAKFYDMKYNPQNYQNILGIDNSILSDKLSFTDRAYSKRNQIQPPFNTNINMKDFQINLPWNKNEIGGELPKAQRGTGFLLRRSLTPDADDFLSTGFGNIKPPKIKLNTKLFTPRTFNTSGTFKGINTDLFMPTKFSFGDIKSDYGDMMSSEWRNQVGGFNYWQDLLSTYSPTNTYHGVINPVQIPSFTGGILEGSLNNKGEISTNVLQQYIKGLNAEEGVIAQNTFNNLSLGNFKRTNFNNFKLELNKTLPTFYPELTDKHQLYGIRDLGWSVPREPIVDDPTTTLSEANPLGSDLLDIQTITWKIKDLSKFKGSKKHFDDEAVAGHTRYVISKYEPKVFDITEFQSDLGQMYKSNYKKFNNLTNLVNKKITGVHDKNVLALDKLGNYNPSTLEGSLYKGFGKGYAKRLLYENINYAVNNGQTIIRFPTAETAAITQRYPLVIHVKPTDPRKMWDDDPSLPKYNEKNHSKSFNDKLKEDIKNYEQEVILYNKQQKYFKDNNIDKDLLELKSKRMSADMNDFSSRIQNKINSMGKDLVIFAERHPKDLHGNLTKKWGGFEVSLDKTSGKLVYKYKGEVFNGGLIAIDKLVRGTPDNPVGLFEKISNIPFNINNYSLKHQTVLKTYRDKIPNIINKEFKNVDFKYITNDKTGNKHFQFNVPKQFLDEPVNTEIKAFKEGGQPSETQNKYFEFFKPKKDIGGEITTPKFKKSPFDKDRLVLYNPDNLIAEIADAGGFTKKFEEGGETNLNSGYKIKKKLDVNNNLPYINYSTKPNIEGRVYYDKDSSNDPYNFNIVDVESSLVQKQRKHQRTKMIIEKYENNINLSPIEYNHLHSLGLLD